MISVRRESGAQSFAGTSGAVRDFAARTAAKVDSLRCPVHGQAPRVRFQGTTLRDVDIRMSGCCEELIGLANRRIAEA